MKLKTKAWLVSQGLLIATALIIQLTFYREIKVGPMLGMPKRNYWDIINNVEPSVPQYAIENSLEPKLYDARLPLTQNEIEKRISVLSESLSSGRGLRMALKGGLVVNTIYLFAFHIIYFLISRSLRKSIIKVRLMLLGCFMLINKLHRKDIRIFSLSMGFFVSQVLWPK